MASLHAALPNPISVLIADSNQVQCQLLTNALRRRPEYNVISCPLDTEVVLRALASTSSIDVMIINSVKSGEAVSDMSVIRRLHLSYPEIPKIVLQDTCDREPVVDAFRSGAKGVFCFSEYPFRLLCKCIQTVHQGQIWANSEQLGYVVEALSDVSSLRIVDAKGFKLLSAREQQVVALVADGLSNRQVATELCLSEHTVKKYLFRIFNKLGVSSRVELTLYAVYSGRPQQSEWLAASA
jgi:DNA-binding NarL/FixJ family response regulator